MRFLNRAPKAPDSPEQMMTVTCPVCSRSLEVECVAGGLHAPAVKCSCGTVINNELGYFTRPS
jgi:uncharacterized Zn finger protein